MIEESELKYYTADCEIDEEILIKNFNKTYPAETLTNFYWDKYLQENLIYIKKGKYYQENMNEYYQWLARLFSSFAPFPKRERNIYPTNRRRFPFYLRQQEYRTQLYRKMNKDRFFLYPI